MPALSYVTSALALVSIRDPTKATAYVTLGNQIFQDDTQERSCETMNWIVEPNSWESNEQPSFTWCGWGLFFGAANLIYACHSNDDLCFVYVVPCE